MQLPLRALVTITKAAVQPPLLGLKVLVTLFALSKECAATSVLFTMHKLCKLVACSLPFNPKLFVPRFSPIINGFQMDVNKGEVLFGRHLNQHHGNLLLGCLRGHGAGVLRSQ
jgi:hypothetical protein